MAEGGNDEFRQRQVRANPRLSRPTMTGWEGSYLKLSLVRSTDSLPMNVERQ
jgi:hypothetical protein